MTPSRWLALWWPRWWKRLALFGVGLVLAWFAYEAVGRWNEARRDARLGRQRDTYATQQRADSARIAAAAAEKAARDTVYLRDTVEVTRTRTAYRTVRDTLLRTVTDTLVLQTVAAADTALAQADTALRSGERRLAAAESLFAAERAGARTDSAAGSVAARLEERARAKRDLKRERNLIAVKALLAGVALESIRRSLSH